jgi:hypothetical protein
MLIKENKQIFMKRLILLFGFLCLFLLTMSCFAKEWRGIFPLKTTRAEVIKLLGEPTKRWGSGGEYFKVEDGKVTISWTHPDCYTEKPIQESAVKSDSLVYQITFIPNELLPNEFLQQAQKEMQPASEIFFVFDGNCLKGGNGTFSCNLWAFKYGFDYSNSHNGVEALYFFPTEKELADWKEKQKSCSIE